MTAFEIIGLTLLVLLGIILGFAWMLFLGWCIGLLAGIAVWKGFLIVFLLHALAGIFK